MTTITKRDIAAAISSTFKIAPTTAEEIVSVTLVAIADQLAAGNRCEFRDFGVFDVKHRAARKAQNPKTLEAVEVPPRRVVTFKVGRKLKQRVAAS